MSTVRATVTLPKELMARARKALRQGKAKNMSALVSEALDYWVGRDELGQILAEMDIQYGPPSKEAREWAEKIVREDPYPAR